MLVLILRLETIRLDIALMWGESCGAEEKKAEETREPTQDCTLPRAKNHKML